MKSEAGVRGKLASALFALALLAAAPARGQPPAFDGIVTRIDAAAGKITLRHGPMKKLDMETPMTMVFRVSDPGMLKGLKAGDKVRFDADKLNGQYTVTAIEKAE
jgi:Cu/Ag efflux protein CusF